MSPPIAIVLTPDGQPIPDVVGAWLAAHHVSIATVGTADALLSAALRARPRLAVIDARGAMDDALAACRRLKADSFTGIVPALALVRDDVPSFSAAFDAGADEVVREGMDATEVSMRIEALLRRSDRDTFVHPSTRLPGAAEIESDILRRIAAEERFAACYADLDHFKEYNDRYGYHSGDRIIRLLSKILHDVVKGAVAERGFVGHIGGDDFLFIIPADAARAVCGEVVSAFDALIPYQYDAQDRRAGYFLGEDRRGQVFKVPIMTLSIGVVTNERRQFTHASHVSALATEMKTYAKTLAGSVYCIDRRSGASRLSRRRDASALPPDVPVAPLPLSAAGADEHPARGGPGFLPPRPAADLLGSRDATERARRVARALVSDMVAYHPQERADGIRLGTLKELFREEIERSYDGYCDLVGRDFAERTPFFRDALNELLAGGQPIF